MIRSIVDRRKCPSCPMIQYKCPTVTYDNYIILLYIYYSGTLGQVGHRVYYIAWGFQNAFFHLICYLFIYAKNGVPPVPPVPSQ